MKNRNINLDILRIIACYLVLMIHIGSMLGFSKTGIGAYGVQLFFIMSGYFAFKTYEKTYYNDNHVKEYYKNRIKRIVPFYWLSLLFYYIYYIIIYINNGASFTDIFINGMCGIKYLRYVFFLQLILPTNDYSMWCNMGALWSMSSFAIFYLLVPLIYKLCHRFWTALIGLILFLCLNPSLQEIIYNRYNGSTDESQIIQFALGNPMVNLYCFFGGITLYYAIKEKKETWYCLFMLVILLYNGLSFKTMECIFLFIVIIFIKSETLISNEKCKKIILYLSKTSFPLYLIHSLILGIDNQIIKIFGIVGKMELFLIYFITVLPLFYFIYYFCEKLILRLKSFYRVHI